MLIVFKDPALQVNRPVLEASSEETSGGKISLIKEAIRLPIVNSIVEEAIDVSSKKPTLQEASPVLEASEEEKVIRKRSSIEEA